MRNEKEIRAEAKAEFEAIENRKSMETEKLAEILDEIYFSANSPLNK